MEKPIDTSTDVTAMLANVAKAFATRAERSREQAAVAAAEDRSTGRADPEFAGARRREGERFLAEAEAWEARRREAERGYLLLRGEETGDVAFMDAYGGLIRACTAAGRVVNRPGA